LLLLRLLLPLSVVVAGPVAGRAEANLASVVLVTLKI
jgi:hypothetical protein